MRFGGYLASVKGTKFFLMKKKGKLSFVNASVNVLWKVQKVLEEAEEELGIQDEQDIVNIIKEVRAERDIQR